MSNNSFLKLFSNDGYIINQDLLDDTILYKGHPARINGCGYIAAYNLLHANNIDIFHDNVRISLDRISTSSPWPTPTDVLYGYIKKYINNAEEVTDNASNIIDLAKKYNSGIFRYTEDGTPHYVAFVKTNGDNYRFFNVGDYFTDKEMSIDKFIRNHMQFNEAIYCILCI